MDYLIKQSRSRGAPYDHLSVYDQSSLLMEPRFQLLAQALGGDLFTKIREAKLLVVGAGGIGCELLKNLVLSGFKDIEVVDLDTIDLSNLNRQFLFQKQHIGKPKAVIAQEAVTRFCPTSHVTAHHANIKDHAFGPEYFSRFTLVMNALDNLAARRHVNRICLAANVPLIESGTAGYLGQVSVHLKGRTECYECQPKPPAKTFATCTIRNNPTSPIHCVVWAKFLFSRLFGKQDDQNAVTELEQDEALVEKQQQPQQADPEMEREVATLASYKQRDFGEWIFYKVFHTDILRLVRMKDMWKERAPPVPLSMDGLKKLQQQAQATAGAHGLRDQQVWTAPQCAEEFFAAVKRLKDRAAKEGLMEFSKDDEDALTFVTAASNLRSHIFGIPLQSRFDVKAAAGNIIPAIATTNAVIAGMIVMEAMKLLAAQPDRCRATYLNRKPSRNRLLVTTQLEPPNPSCFVCGSRYIQLKIDTRQTTFGEFIDRVLIQRLGFNEPNIDTGRKFFEGGTEGLDEDEIRARDAQMPKSLESVDIVHNSVISISDQSQSLDVQIAVVHCDTAEFPESNTAKFEVIGSLPQAKQDTPAPAAAAAKTAAGAAAATMIIEDDDLLVVDKPIHAPTPTPAPAPAPAAAMAVDAQKKRKQAPADDEEAANGKKKKPASKDGAALVLD